MHRAALRLTNSARDLQNGSISSSSSHVSVRSFRVDAFILLYFDIRVDFSFDKVILFAVVYASVSWEKWLVSLLLLFFLYVRQVGFAPLRRLFGRRPLPAADPAPAAAPAPAPAPPAPPAGQRGAPPATGQQGATPAPHQQTPSTSASSSTSTSPAEGQNVASESTSTSDQPPQQEPPAPVVREEPVARRILQTGAQFVIAFVGSLFPAHTVDQQPAVADAPPNNQQRNQEQHANPVPAAQ